jgi:hypothetical protein
MEQRKGCWSALPRLGKGQGIQPPELRLPESRPLAELGTALDSMAVDHDSRPPIPTASIELLSAPGHGRTTFVWALLFMLRQLSRVWPGYLCWPGDQATAKSLEEIHYKLKFGQLPDRSAPGTAPRRHTVHLRNLNPWGDRHFAIWDAQDEAFAPSSAEAARADRRTDWNVPALWLLSLPDLDDVSGRFLDLALDNLLRARLTEGDAASERQLRLVVVLTKADAITDLPAELRALLKDDPLSRGLVAGSGGLFRAHDDVVLPAGPPAYRPEPFPINDPLRQYFDTRHEVDALVRAWMSSNSAGRSLLGRAEELDVALRFSLVSATGSGFANGNRLATEWRPRRVLDPYFWSLDLGA